MGGRNRLTIKVQILTTSDRPSAFEMSGRVQLAAIYGHEGFAIS